MPEPALAVVVPPQVLDAGEAISSPDGKLSVKERLDSDVVFGLEMLIVSVAVPFTGIVALLNELVTVGASDTVRVAESVFPVPPLSEVALKLTGYTPCASVRIVIVNMQLVFGAISAPVRVMVEGLVRVTVPVAGAAPIFGQTGVCEALLTCIPTGKLAVNDTLVRLSGFVPGLLIVICNPEGWVVLTDGWLKLISRTGGASTFKVAVAVPPGAVSSDVMAPVVLVFMPFVVEVTSTLN